MADRIKGITIEIGGDTTGLSKALSSTNKEIKSTQAQLKDVEKLLKLDPTNVDLLRQREELLNKAVAETKNKLDALKDAQAQVQAQMDKGEATQEQYDALTREIVATEKALEDLEKEAREANSTLQTISATADKVASGADKVADATKGLSTAAAGAITGLVGLAVSAASSADELATLAAQSGFSTDTLQEWNYAAELVDVSADTMISAARKMKKNMASDTGSAAEAWAQLGVSVRDSSGEYRDTEEVFYDTLEALSQVTNETERDILAMDIFGKSADELAGIIDDGGEALRALGQEAQEAGVILSEDSLNAAVEFDDALQRLKATAGGEFLEIGAEIAEYLTPMLEKLATKISEVLSWFTDLDSTQQGLILTILAVVAAISPMATAISKVATLISFVSGTVIPALGTALDFLAANPIVLVIAAIVGLIAICVKWGDQIVGVFDDVNNFLQRIFLRDWSQSLGAVGDVLNGLFSSFSQIFNGIKDIFSGIVNFVKNVFTGNWKGAWDAVKQIFQGVWDALSGIVKAPINAIIGIINGLISGLNFLIRGLNKISFSIPDWVPLLGGKTFGFHLNEINKISYLAKGGALDSGSAIVGEAGPELLTVASGRSVVQPLSGATGGTNGLTELTGLLNQYLPYLAEGSQIVLDSGALVGATAPAMNKAFAKMASREAHR